jgi:hypothetical protein
MDPGELKKEAIVALFELDFFSVERENWEIYLL